MLMTLDPRPSTQMNLTIPNKFCGSRGAVGFTLFEIMVALCVVAILSAFAIPGFKKISDDMKINQTVNDTLALIKSMRSYYLIFNEFCPDGKYEYVDSKMRPFLPSCFITDRVGHGTQINPTCCPLNNSNYYYDVNLFLGRAGTIPHTLSLSMVKRNNSSNKGQESQLAEKLKACLGEIYVQYDPSPYGVLNIMMPECPVSNEASILTSKNISCENRYY